MLARASSRFLLPFSAGNGTSRVGEAHSWGGDTYSGDDNHAWRLRPSISRPEMVPDTPNVIRRLRRPARVVFSAQKSEPARPRCRCHRPDTHLRRSRSMRRNRDTALAAAAQMRRLTGVLVSDEFVSLRC